MSNLIDRQTAIDALWSLDAELRPSTIDAILSMLNGLPSAHLEQRWIPVNERLPEEERKHYWICTDSGYQCECRWTNNIYGLQESDNWGWSIFDIPQYSKVVAWMPLPEPWKGESDAENHL